MEFKQWLEENTNESNSLEKSNKFSDFKTRVQTGRQIENKILNALRTNVGWQIVLPTMSEDKYDKIDGWIIENNKKIPLQIKYRDKSSGSDIFMEIMKDYYKKIPGRDMIGKAKIYVTLANNLLMIRDAEEAKKIANEMTKELEQKILTNPQITRLTTSKGMIMISPDPATGVEKLKAYINPNAFSWKKNIPLSSSLF